MTKLNQLYLSKLTEKYEIEKTELFEKEFSSYKVLLNKRNIIYLMLCNDYTSIHNVNEVLDIISILERNHKKGNSYLCIVPMEEPTVDLCTHFNGKSFVHFIFYSKESNTLTYDKNIYYLGSKHMKCLIDIYQTCFDELRENTYDEEIQ